MKPFNAFIGHVGATLVFLGNIPDESPGPLQAFQLYAIRASMVYGVWFTVVC